MSRGARLLAALISAGTTLCAAGLAAAQNRFPQPDFDSLYALPVTAVPPPRALFLEYFDVAVLVAALALASWIALRSRSRREMSLLSVFSLLYFGFWRKGCVCAVGATQNVLLALFDGGGYAVPLTVLAFFLLPLFFSLLFGRTFCAGVCPLGALQDIVVLKPLRLPPALLHSLGMIPYLYLGLVVLYVFTGAGYMICRYEPFVPLYRLSGSTGMLWTGAAFLVAGIWVARPYCRFLCPYGVLLKWTSRFSKSHAAITPAECVRCRLCENSCPFGSILPPFAPEEEESLAAGRGRLWKLLVALPLLTLAGGLAGSLLETPLSLAHPTVRLADQVFREDAGEAVEETLPSEAFRESEVPASVLYNEAAALKKSFGRGGILLGAFTGFLFGGKLIGLSLRRRRDDYEPDRGTCLSCTRCFETCPVDHVHRHGHPGEYADLLAKLETREEDERRQG
jgi:ferredoxin